MNKSSLKLLKELTELNGISGFENDVREYIKNELKDICTSITTDNLGSLICELKTDETKPLIMFTAHMDEVGFLVNSILDNGMIRLKQVGGWWSHVLLAQEMVVTNHKHQEFIGVIGAEPPHGLTREQKNQVLPIDTLYLDMGVSSKQNILDLGINIGDPITPLTKFRVLNDHKTLLGKAFDNRLSIAIIIDLFKTIKRLDIPANVIFVASTQEEIGCRGAKTSTYLVEPDIGFAIDVTESYDTPGAENNPSRLGTGPALALMDGASISHRGLFDLVEEVAKRKSIPYTYDLCVFGGTDSSEIHKTKMGIINMTLSIPCRYFHSHTSLIHKDDFDNTKKLLLNLIKVIDNDKLRMLKESKYL